MFEPVNDAPPVPRFLRRLSDLADRHADPMLVRCVRQELRSKAFIGAFAMALLIAVIATITVAGFSSTGVNERAGLGLFTVLAFVWGGAVLIFQAGVTARTVANERNDDTWDLVELTGQGPWPMVRGLWLANLVQSQLYAAALAPFLVMAYFLRGVEIPLILLTLLCMPLAGAAAGALAVFAACQGQTKQARASAFGLLMIGLAIAGLSSIGGVVGALRFGSASELLRPLWELKAEAWMVLGAILNGWAAFVLSALVLATSSLTHRAQDRSRGPRLVALGLWLNLALWVGGVLIYLAIAKPADVSDAITNGCIVLGAVGILLAAALGLFAICEERLLSPAQLRAIDGSRWSFLLGPGSDRGKLATVALIALSVAALLLGFAGDAGSYDQKSILGWIGAACYLSAYLAVAVLSLRLLPQRLAATPGNRRWWTLGVMAILLAVPMVYRAFLSYGDHSPVLLVSAIGGIDAMYDHDDGFAVVLVVIAGLAGWATLLLQGLKRSRGGLIVRAGERDRNPRGG